MSFLFSSLHYQYLTLGADDHPSQNMRQFFDNTNAFIVSALSNNGRVLVHCAAGISRASTIVIAFLMWRLKLPLAHACSLLKSIRPVIWPNDGFVEQLRAYEKELGLLPTPPTKLAGTALEV